MHFAKLLSSAAITAAALACVTAQAQTTNPTSPTSPSTSTNVSPGGANGTSDTAGRTGTVGRNAGTGMGSKSDGSTRLLSASGPETGMASGTAMHKTKARSKTKKSMPASGSSS